MCLHRHSFKLKSIVKLKKCVSASCIDRTNNRCKQLRKQVLILPLFSCFVKLLCFDSYDISVLIAMTLVFLLTLTFFSVYYWITVLLTLDL